jgi:hypothetical protein
MRYFILDIDMRRVGTAAGRVSRPVHHLGFRKKIST